MEYNFTVRMIAMRVSLVVILIGVFEVGSLASSQSVSMIPSASVDFLKDYSNFYDYKKLIILADSEYKSKSLHRITES